MKDYTEILKNREELSEAEAIGVLFELDDAYFNLASFVSDEVYDDFYLWTKRNWPTNGYFKQIGSSVRGAEIEHNIPVGGIDQLHIGETGKWFNEHKNKVHFVSEKLDGGSATLTYVSGMLRCAATRGDGTLGKDVTRHLIKLDSVPHAYGIGFTSEVLDIRGEVIIRKSNFRAIIEVLLQTKGREYKNLRNTVNGLLNATEIPEEVLPFIEFVAYDIAGSNLNKSKQFELLKDMGFQTPRFNLIEGEDLSEEVLSEILLKYREESEFEIDGIVVELAKAEDREGLFPTDSNPNPDYAFKWKVADASNLATGNVLAVEWNISKHDYFKPVVIIEPVDINGITVQRLTGFNASFIIANGIGPGAQVTFTRSGDVIPYILDVPVKVEPELPNAPWDWNETGVDAIAIESSPESHLKRVKHFFNTLKVDNLQEASIQKLIDAGYENIEQILVLPEEVLVDILGKNGSKAFTSLHHKLSSVELHELMGAWPYMGRGFGVRKSKALLTGLASWKTAGIDDIISVEGFSDKTASVFIAGRVSFIEFVEWLESIGLVSFVVKDVITGPFTGITFAFTGIRLKDKEEILVSLGAEIHDGVKKNTTFLVAKDPNKKSNKLEKAIERGTIVIGLSDLNELINEKMK